MAREIFADTGGDLLQCGVNVLVHGYDDIVYSFALGRLVMLISMRPDRCARTRIEQFDLEREARRQIGFVDFGHVPEVATNNIVPAYVAAKGRNSAILAAGTQSGNEQVLEHIRRGFSPAVIRIGSELHGAGAEHDTIVAKEMRGGDAANEQSYLVSGSSLRRWDGAWIDHIVFHRARGNAAREADQR